MNLVIIGRFPAATDTQIRAFLPADREVFITESDLSGPFLQSADALIPEHIPIPSFWGQGSEAADDSNRGRVWRR